MNATVTYLKLASVILLLKFLLDVRELSVELETATLVFNVSESGARSLPKDLEDPEAL
jgi:hypothetical protein